MLTNNDNDPGAPDDENYDRNQTGISNLDLDLSEVIHLIYSGGDDRNYRGVHDTSSRSSDNLSYLVDHGDAIKGINSFGWITQKNLVFCHYNINSIRNKFHELSSVLTDQSVDIMAIG